MSGPFARYVAPRLPVFGRLALRLDARRAAAIEPVLAAERARVDRVAQLLRRLDETAAPANDASAFADELDDHVRALTHAIERHAVEGRPGLRLIAGLDAWTRCDRPEILDGHDVSPRRRSRAMRGLARLNARSGAEATWAAEVADRLAALPVRAGPRHVYELAAGTGDFARRLHHQLSRDADDDRPVRITVSDLDEDILARPRPDEGWLTAERRDARVLDGLDDVQMFVCVQAAHHLRPGDVVRTIRSSLRATGGIVLIDVFRAPAHTLVAAVGALVFGRNWIVIKDGVRSIRRGFTPAELELLAYLAGARRPIDARAVAPAYSLLHATARGEPNH